MQLQPHFLFNALNTVAMLVRQGDSQSAVRMLARLSELLRHILEEAGEQEASLEEELDLLTRYLEIEQVRFGDRLEVTVDLDEDARHALVPNLLLQPLAENAIRHGIARRAASGRIELSARREADRLILQLRNDGPDLPGGWSLDAGAGIGLRNTAARLRHLYGDAATLRLINSAEGGVEARVYIPYHTRPRVSAESAT
jgi:LytS/YehU family sensor histidine kinase